MNTLSIPAALLTLTLLLGCSASNTDGATGGGGDSVTSSSSATASSSTGGATGGAGGMGSMLDGPIERGELLVLEFSPLYFEVDPSSGARISALRLNGSELLTDAKVNAVNWGSTFWTSPQSDWGWPPPTAVDSDTYTPTVGESSFTAVGLQANFAGKTVAIEKKFAADFARAAVVITYTTRNTGGAPFNVAPWEVTRVAQGGLTFFPTGDIQFTPGGSNPLPVFASANVTWFNGAAHPPDGQQKKMNADGKEGWVAHVAGDLLFLKTFADVPSSAQAPGEGEVEIFAQTASEGGYVEVENQGSYAEIPPGGSSTYEVTWIVRELPSGVTAEVGSAALLDFVRSLL